MAWLCRHCRMICRLVALVIFLHLVDKFVFLHPKDFVSEHQYNYANHSWDVPDHLLTWRRYALDKKCPPNAYKQVDADFKPFYELVKYNASLFCARLQEVTRIRRDAGLVVLRIRQGKAMMDDTVHYLNDYVEFIEPFVKYLPDMDIPLNHYDEPRVLASSNDAIRLHNTEPDLRLVGRKGEPTVAYFDQQCGQNNSMSRLRNEHGFLISPGLFSVTLNLFPIFSPGKTDCFFDIIIPSVYNIAAAKRFKNHNTINSILVPWFLKKDVLFWRGSTTGGYHQLPNGPWRKFHRHRLIEWARSHNTHHANHSSPDFVPADIHYTDIIQADYQAYSSILSQTPPVQRVPESTHWHYKYLMDVDGNSFSQRFFVFLHFNSVVFRAGVFQDWFGDRVEPWVHYVPVSLTYRDLREKLTWARRNDGEARRIAERAMKKAWSEMRVEDMECYLFRVLAEYANLLRQAECYLNNKEKRF